MSPQPPYGLVVAGPPASGKTTLARALAAALPAALLDLDVVTGPLTAVLLRMLGVQEDFDDPRVREATRDARYEALTATAVDNVAVGTSVVLVAPFTRERDDARAWIALRERLRGAGASAPLLVWLHCSGDELLRRLAARAAARDDAKLAAPAAFLAQALRVPASAHLAVDSTWPLSQQVGTVLRALPVARGGETTRDFPPDNGKSVP